MAEPMNHCVQALRLLQSTGRVVRLDVVAWSAATSAGLNVGEPVGAGWVGR